MILQWLDIPNLTLNNIDYGQYPFYNTADVQATSTILCFSFHFKFHFHFLDADSLANYIQNRPKQWSENEQ